MTLSLNHQTKEAKWLPADSIELESAALDVVKSKENYYVLAGPGAGKTELLAQRACYLLQTNICFSPRKILAISFKRDAKKNIAERVAKRCGDELGFRFVSQTYDSFAKNLLDHFRLAIPLKFQPLKDYVVTFDKIETYSKEKLTFEMISRLAKYIIEQNPFIKKALNSTYSHVFLDEFQDTTQYQYQLIKACFGDSDTILTSVGDPKQRIMLWAGADLEVFDKFKDDFHAIKKNLMMNHRSAPKLVDIQKVLTKRITGVSEEIITNQKWNDGDGVCEIWTFPDFKKEAAHISKEIQNLISRDHFEPRDICIIVKQKSDQYSKELMEQLTSLGIKTLVEDKIQDLLSEDVPQIILDFILLCQLERSPREYIKLLKILKICNGVIYDSDVSVEKIRKIESSFKLFLIDLKTTTLSVKDDKSMKSVVFSILEYLGIEHLKNTYPQYKNGDLLTSTVDQISKILLKEYLNHKDWKIVIGILKGEDSVPIMTIHKSKGLEYKIVIFLGLEDGAFWSYLTQKEEDTCAFFVALSRAKERVIFTFSGVRNIGKNPQSKQVINNFYDILKESNVSEKVFV